MERYLGGEEIDTATLIDDLETAVARGSFHPVVPVCAMSGVGLDALLELLVGGFPSPLEHPLPRVSGIDGSPRAPADRGPGRAARGRGRPHLRGRLRRPGVAGAGVLRDAAARDRRCTSAGTSRGRPRTGDETSDDGGHDADERLAHVYVPLGAQLREVEACVAGDIAALTKLGSAETGDTVSAASDPLLLSCWNLPDPLLPVAVVARSRADEDALGRSLDPARRRGPDAAPGAQPRDPPDGAVVHGRGARGRRAVPAAGRAAPRSTPSR